jgi:hypothetical protein
MQDINPKILQGLEMTYFELTIVDARNIVENVLKDDVISSEKMHFYVDTLSGKARKETKRYLRWEKRMKKYFSEEEIFYIKQIWDEENQKTKEIFFQNYKSSSG